MLGSCNDVSVLVQLHTGKSTRGSINLRLIIDLFNQVFYYETKINFKHNESKIFGIDQTLSAISLLFIKPRNVFHLIPKKTSFDDKLVSITSGNITCSLYAS